MLARWYGSSGSWEKRIEEKALDVSVAIATTRVIVLCVTSVFLFTSNAELVIRGRPTVIEKVPFCG